MKPSEKDKRVFDYMQEQANNLLAYCVTNGIDLENLGFFVDPDTGYAYISAGATEKDGSYLLCRSKSHNKFGGAWNTDISVIKTNGEQNDE